MPNQEEIPARALAEFLVARDRYNGVSPLERRVQVEIETLTRTLAADIVDSLPELRQIINEKCLTLVRRTMNDDEMMNAIVVKAVAAALMNHTPQST